MTTSAEQQKSAQREQWGRAAGAWARYDAWLDAAYEAVSSAMCDGAGVASGMRALDVACGTGGLTAELARRVGPHGRVMATDLAPEMVEAARRRLAALGLDVDVAVMDAERLELPDGGFDAATCRFGLMFCPDPVRAASELRRVLRPGGRAAVAVWDEAARNPWFTAVADAVGRFVELPRPEPGAPGVFRLGTPGALEATLREAGFADVAVAPLPLVVRYDSPEAYWEMQTGIAAPVQAALQRLSPDGVRRVRDAVLEVAAAHVVDGEVAFTATPLVGVGRR